MSNLAEENEAIPTETGEDLEAVASTEQEPAEGAGEPEVEATGSEEEVIVTLGEEAPPPKEEEAAPEWVRELRKKNRELAKELSHAKKKLEALDAPKPSPLGKKPTMEDEGIEFDEEKYDAALTAWLKRKDAIEQAEAQARKAEEEQAREWQERLATYSESKRSAPFKDFDEVEAEALEILSATQQGIIVQGAKDPAMIIYAIGKNLEKGKKLAAIKDPVKFAFAVANMEGDPSSEFKMTVTKRKSPPPPERQVQGAGRISGTVDQTLARLEEEAEKTGDRTKIIRYKQQLREKGKTT